MLVHAYSNSNECYVNFEDERTMLRYMYLQALSDGGGTSEDSESGLWKLIVKQKYNCGTIKWEDVGEIYDADVKAALGETDAYEDIGQDIHELLCEFGYFREEHVNDGEHTIYNTWGNTI